MQCAQVKGLFYGPERRISLRDADSVVERQAQSLVSVVAAFILEQILLDIPDDREEGAARRVGRDTAAGAVDAALLEDGGYRRRMSKRSDASKGELTAGHGRKGDEREKSGEHRCAW